MVKKHSLYFSAIQAADAAAVSRAVFGVGSSANGDGIEQFCSFHLLI